MVNGISRQVIVVNSPEPKLFEQAIFILNDNALREGVTEERLLKEARKLMAAPQKKRHILPCVFWSSVGVAVTGVAWLLTVLL